MTTTVHLRLILETYSEFALSVKTREYWFRRFKSDDFDLKDQPKKVRIAGIIE